MQEADSVGWKLNSVNKLVDLNVIVYVLNNTKQNMLKQKKKLLVYISFKVDSVKELLTNNILPVIQWGK